MTEPTSAGTDQPAYYVGTHTDAGPVVYRTTQSPTDQHPHPVVTHAELVQRDPVLWPVLVPADAVTASGSGLDPHIGIENALLQVPRVAAARRLPEEDVLKLVHDRSEGRALGIFGEPRVNVLLLNHDLDRKSTPR